MNEAQTKAWNCLREVERQSLFLHMAQGKSSWESGTILNIAHYKYLEIRERSEKFFRMFTEFFTRHSAIFRPDAPCDQRFRDYIEGVIEFRQSRREASTRTGDSTQSVKSINNKLITKSFEQLKNSTDPWDIDTLKLILEFDRWNNFRILPALLQQPSAYKRRANKKDKVYIRYLINKIPDWFNDKIIEKFKYTRVKSSKPKYYVCLISKSFEDGYYILPVRPNDEVVKEMNRFYMYVFADKEDADTFGFMVSKFLDKTSEVKLGQKFWPQYRETVQRAVNYNEVNNIGFNIKCLDMAYQEQHYKKPKKKKSTGAKRASEESLNSTK